MKHTIFFLSSIRKYRKQTLLTNRKRSVTVYMLCYITAGEGTLIINDTVHLAAPSQLFYLIPGMTIAAATQSEEVEYYILILDPVTVNKQKGNWQISDLPFLPPTLLSSKIHVQNTRQIHERIQQLYEQAVKDSPKAVLNDMSWQLQFQELFRSIILDSANQNKVENTSNGVEQSVDYIQKFFRKNITLQTLSEITKLTPGSYSRSFKKAMGISPIEYLTKVRVDSAKDKLSNSNCTIKEVSSLVGYNNEFYFSRVFKKTVGIAPTLYMKRHQLKVAAISCYGYHDNLYSLGIHPVASVNCYRYPGMNEAEHKEWVSLKLEEVRQTKPDLIIGDFYHLDFYDRLKQIAPTVYLKHHTDWRVNHRKLAELFGCENEAELRIKQMEARTKEARTILQQSIGSKTVTLMRVTYNTVRIQGTDFHPLNCLIYNELGLNSGNILPKNLSKMELQPEAIPPMNSDYLFIDKRHLQAGSEKIFTRMQNTSSWSNIEAVRNNKIRFIPNWFAMSWTAIGRNRIIDELIEV